MALPGDTLVYAGHDYVLEALKYAKIIEPDNPDLKGYRITSYNVCYTKLLRKISVSV